MFTGQISVVRTIKAPSAVLVVNIRLHTCANHGTSRSHDHGQAQSGPPPQATNVVRLIAATRAVSN